MIRVNAIWLATEHMEMRAGTETALARVVAVFGAAKPHCAYLFASRRENRVKVLVHDGGIWLVAPRFNQGKFHWPGVHRGAEVELGPEITSGAGTWITLAASRCRRRNYIAFDVAF